MIMITMKLTVKHMIKAHTHILFHVYGQPKTVTLHKSGKVLKDQTIFLDPI